jgi:AraC-like DNA-binding protein
MQHNPSISNIEFLKFRKGESIKMGSPSHHSFLWCISGLGTLHSLEHNGSFSQLEYLYLPNQHHLEFRSDKNNPFQIACITLSHCENLINQQTMNKIIQLKLRSSDPLMLLSDYIVQHFKSIACTDDSRFHLARILVCEAQHAFANNRQPSHLMASLELYIDQNISQKISIQDLAAVIHRSPSQLHRLCVSFFKQSPGHWINLRRIKKARQLLLTTELSLKNISQQVGFHEQFHFSKNFKKIVGISPLKFRQSAT